MRPTPGEDEKLAAERLVLANADRLGRLGAEAYAALYDGEHAALTSLALVWRRVGELADLDDQFASYVAIAGVVSCGTAVGFAPAPNAHDRQTCCAPEKIGCAPAGGFGSPICGQ